jgi:hypothetical protein
MQGRRGRLRNMDSAWLSYVRKGCCCTARLHPLTRPPARATNAASNYVGKTGGGEKRSQSLARSPDSTVESLPAMLCAAIVFTKRNIRITHFSSNQRDGPTSKVFRGGPFPLIRLLFNLNVAAHHAALLKIALMVLLSLPEDPARIDLRCYRTAICA